jgi:hypothetical protein
MTRRRVKSQQFAESLGRRTSPGRPPSPPNQFRPPSVPLAAVAPLPADDDPAPGYPPTVKRSAEPGDLDPPPAA